MCREPVSRIDFMSLDIGDPFLFIDDGIVAKMIETGIGAKSATSKGDHAERDEMQVLIKMLQIRSLTFNCDVHLSKSDWLPIAVDATRCVSPIVRSSPSFTNIALLCPGPNFPSRRSTSRGKER
jgi:hypothetical protein